MDKSLSQLSLFDMHCHLDFFDQPRELADTAHELGLGILAVSVTPQGYERAYPELADLSSVRLGVGAHPWWIADGCCSPDDIERVCELARDTRYIAEVGLDFSDKHTSPLSHEVQVDAFVRICSRAAELSAKVLSIHAVRAANTVLDILEQTSALKNCDCIFHWFSGSTDELWRAIKAGCYFSINEMMLGTKRAREYMKLIPEERLLLETDLPPQNRAQDFGAADIRASLERALGRLAEYRGCSVEKLAEQICVNSARLLV